MEERGTILSDEDHKRMDDFFEKTINAFKEGKINQESVIAGFGQFVGAVDIGNKAEVKSWLDQEGISHFKKLSSF